MTTVVLINGEKQVGKTTLANQILDACQAAGRSAETYSLVRPVFPAALKLAGIVEATDYEEFKKTLVMPMLGIDGRQIMIEVGNAARRLHPYFLNQVFMNFAMRNTHIDTWVIENWGFGAEYEFFIEDFPRAIFNNVVLVHLDSRATRHYEHGEQFDNDNRFCLRDLAHLVNPTVDQVLDRITGEFKMKFKFSPVEAMQQIDSEKDSDWEADGRPSFARIRELTHRPDLSDADIQAIIDKYGFPNRETLRTWAHLGAETTIDPLDTVVDKPESEGSETT